MNERLLSIDDVAALFGVSRRQVHRYVDEKLLFPVKLGKLTKFLSSEVEKVFERLKSNRKL